MNKVFTKTAWEEYQYWQKESLQILKRIDELIKNIERNGNMGIGKPEPLRHELAGYWSRRINNEHRLIYSIEGNNINIISCLRHY